MMFLYEVILLFIVIIFKVGKFEIIKNMIFDIVCYNKK